MSENSHLKLAFPGHDMKPSRSSKITTVPRKAASQQRSQNTVAALLAGTARVLVRDGFDRASTNKIAQEAGVSIGSLYQYFPSKEALVAALIEKETEHDLAAIKQCLKELENAPTEQALRKIILVVAQCYAKNKALRRVILDQVPKVGKLQKIRELENEVGGIIYEKITRNRKLTPQIHELNKFILTKGIMGVIRSAIFERADYLDTNELVERMASIYLQVFETSAQYEVKPADERA